MPKMTKAQARNRLSEANDKVLKVMFAGHISNSAAVKISDLLLNQIKRLK
jgi:hypothetical protein